MNFEDAPCFGVPTEVFFDWNGYTQVIELYCSRCSVLQQCLDAALKAESITYEGTNVCYRAGVFGGTTPEERNQMEGTRWRCLNDNDGYSN